MALTGLGSSELSNECLDYLHSQASQYEEKITSRTKLSTQKCFRLFVQQFEIPSFDHLLQFRIAAELQTRLREILFLQQASQKPDEEYADTIKNLNAEPDMELEEQYDIESFDINPLTALVQQDLAPLTSENSLRREEVTEDVRPEMQIEKRIVDLFGPELVEIMNEPESRKGLDQFFTVPLTSDSAQS